MTNQVLTDTKWNCYSLSCDNHLQKHPSGHWKFTGKLSYNNLIGYLVVTEAANGQSHTADPSYQISIALCTFLFVTAYLTTMLCIPQLLEHTNRMQLTIQCKSTTCSRVNINFYCVNQSFMLWGTKEYSSLVPRPLSDFISQPWRKIWRRPGTNTTSQTRNGGLDFIMMATYPRNMQPVQQAIEQ